MSAPIHRSLVALRLPRSVPALISVAKALVQSMTKIGAWPGSANVTGPEILPFSSVGRNTCAEKVTSVARRSNGGLLLLKTAAAWVQRLMMLNGKPPMLWVPQA